MMNTLIWLWVVDSNWSHKINKAIKQLNKGILFSMINNLE